MQSRQKCCHQCQDSWKSGDNLKNNNYCIEDKVSSSYDHGLSGKKQAVRQNSVTNRFKIARKFHDVNLQHQPLPDKVDDSAFKNIRLYHAKQLSKSTPDLTNDIELRGKPRSRKIHASLQYGPSLGCKIPTTNMDLAICWEAPIDPLYEPAKTVHIDGSDGGPAPAIFALVQHETKDEKIYKTPVERFESKFSNVRGQYNPAVHQQNYTFNKTTHHSSKDEEARKFNDDICDNFNSLRITEPSHRVNSGLSMNIQGKSYQPCHSDNYKACNCKDDTPKKLKRPIFSAPAYRDGLNYRRNRLATQVMIPRPRTPYAKRNFCIDTLAPPFSIVEGSRDSDYPEHWRLASVYQQSYRNPRRNPI
ncbi:uncharacterized protein LOC122857744 [Aphidius gifuensis]|uniref:uncharacterized protein LOC122857744 n=1 Tax=Aphidius gifuensis TaxID=684658 RepID=UPI001CDD0F99|nr:uncharacterized protein LOC122857744 [Aphidius gifuensis]